MHRLEDASRLSATLSAKQRKHVQIRYKPFDLGTANRGVAVTGEEGASDRVNQRLDPEGH